MYVEGFLATNKKMNSSVSGTNVYLGKGELVQVVCKPSNHTYTLRRGDQVQLPDGLTFDSVDVTNLGAEGEISLVCVGGKFFPSIDGSKLNVNAELGTNELSVSFIGRQPVSLPSNQQVRATIDNLPDVIPVQVQNPLVLPKVQQVHVVETSAPNLRYVAHETMTATGTISGNTNRKELILKASDGNPSSCWLGGYEDRGYELRAGEGFVLSNGAEVEVLIPVNCKLYVSEVTA